MLSLIIPTHNRPADLAATLAAIERLSPQQLGPGAEVLIADNASRPPAAVPAELASGVPVRVLRMEDNLAAAARNRLAQAARGHWLVMLDDDSAPLAGELAAVLAAMPADVAAVGGEIVLPGGGREAGGLPEVVIGCGCAVRRDAFLSAGGYDPSFEYYAEEYDLCARLIAAGRRVVQTRAIRFEHRKARTGRDFGRIIARLVRNNAWVMRRYAPDDEVEQAVAFTIDRYARIARRERADHGFEAGLAELDQTLDRQVRTPLTRAQWDRFTGRAAARAHLAAFAGPDAGPGGLRAARLVAAGKGAEIVADTLEELGVRIDSGAAAGVIATLSPGPMLDAADADAALITPWWPEPAGSRRTRAAVSAA